MPTRSDKKSTKAKSAPKPGYVLFVEDQNMLRLLAREAFGYEGICAAFAADGCEAVEYFNTLLADSNPMPRIVFLDILMPCLDGREVYEKLCAEPFLSRLHKTTFVITSAAQDALKLPTGPLATRVLYKPYEVGTLIAMVRSIAPDLIA
ncbi:MAG TPA: response regulator, partial [Aggregatilineales bacterium]|nr:response regulator [Aggregatilineales bacterium]